MRRLYVCVFALVLVLANVGLSNAQSVVVDEEHFPDPEFRRLLVSMGYGDHPEKIASATTLELFRQTDHGFLTHQDPYEIKSLKGLEYFVSLKDLTIDGFYLNENFDFSCFGTLNYLRYTGIHIDSLDLSNLVVWKLELETVCNHFVFPKQVKKYLDIYVSTHESNPDFVDVVMPNYANLKELHISSRCMKFLDLTGCPNLETLHFHPSPELENVILTHNFKLRELKFKEDFNNSSPSYRLSSLNISGNPNLEVLYVFRCPVESLNLKYNTKLQEIRIRKTNIKELDILEMPDLKYVEIMYNNQLATLNIGNAPELTELKCPVNMLEELTLTNSTKLEFLQCCFNKLTSLDFSLPNLHKLHIHMNQIGEEAMTRLINNLPDNGRDNYVVLDMHDSEEEGNFRITQELFELAKAKKWQPYWAIFSDYNCNFYLENNLSYQNIKYSLSNVGISDVLMESPHCEVYNINGQRIISPSQKGLYIRNGKKYVK